MSSGAPKGLTSARLAKVCGVSARTVRNWLVEKPPLPSALRGNRRVFDPPKVAQWLHSMGKTRQLERMNAYVASLEKPEPKPVSAEDAKAEEFAKKTAKAKRQTAADKQAIQKAVAAEKAREQVYDIFDMKRETMRQYAEAMSALVASGPLDKLVHQKNVISIADVARKLELDCLEVAEKMGMVMQVSDVVSAIGEATAKIRQGLLVLRDSAPPDLAAMDDEGQIREYLDGKVHDLLNHLSEALRKMSSRALAETLHVPGGEA